MHILFNASAASSGSGLTYVRNVAPVLARRSDLRATFLVGPKLGSEIGNWSNVAVREVGFAGSALARFFWEQASVPRLATELGADILVSAGNFAVRKSPVPQILLSGNSLYTSQDYRRDLRVRREYGMWVDNEARALLAAKSVGWATATVAPSEAFAQQLRSWTGDNRVFAIHHGFDESVFFAEHARPNVELQTVLESTKDCLCLLFVSHYNYFRNFETLLRAFHVVRAMLPEKNPKLLLTTRLRGDANPGSFRPDAAAALVRELDLSEHVIELGAVAYAELHHVYRAADIYVTASYAETFAHPLVEAMSCGVPIVASDLSVHREVASGAAVYFSRFDFAELALRVREVVNSPELAQSLSQSGRRRAGDFSWDEHVNQLVLLGRDLLARTGREPNSSAQSDVRAVVP